MGPKMNPNLSKKDLDPIDPIDPYIATGTLHCQEV